MVLRELQILGDLIESKELRFAEAVELSGYSRLRPHGIRTVTAFQ